MSGPETFIGEDILVARCTDSKLLAAKAEYLHQSGLWEEVVQGIADLTVKYDPLNMSDAEAEAHFRHAWDVPTFGGAPSAKVMVLQASFAEQDAPDRGMVADRIGVNEDGLAAWIAQRGYRISMMGFQPGFAYLEDKEPDKVPTLARLDTPRQRVAAGSIGFLGGRACIYALDGPGGWPIIGRVHEPLFRRDHAQPFLLKPGQMLRFLPT